MSADGVQTTAPSWNNVVIVFEEVLRIILALERDKILQFVMLPARPVGCEYSDLRVVRSDGAALGWRRIRRQEVQLRFVVFSYVEVGEMQRNWKDLRNFKCLMCREVCMTRVACYTCAIPPLRPTVDLVSVAQRARSVRYRIAIFTP